MAKQIKIKDGKDLYTLEYTLASVKELEQKGICFNEKSDDKFFNSAEQLWEGAFLAHHKDTYYGDKAKIKALWAKLKDKTSLYNSLIEMYLEPRVAFFADPDEDEGNASWEATW